MPLILPLLEQKRKQVYSDLQIELDKLFHELRDFNSLAFSGSTSILKWLSDVTPTEMAVNEIVDKYENLITAITEEIMETNDKKNN